MKTKFSRLAVLATVLSVTLIGCGQKTSSTPADSMNVDTSPAATSPTTNPAPANPTPSVPDQPATSVPKPADTAHHSYSVTALDFANSNWGWVGGKGFILNTTNGGHDWNVQYDGPYEIDAFSFLNANTGWALGHDGDGEVGGVVLQTKDGGLHWNEISHPAHVRNLHFVSETTGFGSDMITQDGGKTWTPVKAPDSLMGNPAFSDANHGWAVTAEGNSFQIQHTADGGQTWTKLFSRPTQEPPVTASVQTTSPVDAWVMIVGSSGMTQTSFSIFHTSDGGANWQPVIAQSTAGGGTAPGYDTPNTGPKGPASKPGYLEVVNSQVAMLSGFCGACGEGTISTGWTVNNGKTWTNSTQQIPGSGGQLSFVNANQGWLITSPYDKPSVLYNTQTSGQTWTQEFVFGPK
ncbi:hypothetical protein JJB07_08705 [Tumebacillus sp. ITR2]|uniref:Photosynthesis system II assembly factor Ycf48/Hcf136-like domain-containing protein n=1 Tax=Tumebacillus amylolyticus TaxID=2801339 RepID=A0ABS1J8X7_9BACL|nr:hypothetical protein [Tumebacillus amylolyticus]MBL0386731.1 hypothetical protein [Tumebacillus amylolyticus]